MDSQAVRQQLDRVLHSRVMARSQRARELLRYIVETSLDGRAQELNGTTIAQDVFDKGADFDPATDPIVRVQMGRLRRLLADYYTGEGQDDPVRIAIPKGGSAPSFARLHPDRQGDQAKAAAPPFWRAVLGEKLVIGALGAAVATAFIFVLLTLMPRSAPSSVTVAEDYPHVVVLPFQNLTEVAANDDFESGFQNQLAADLQRYRTLRVSQADTDARLGEIGADYAILGTLLGLDGKVDFLIQLIDVSEDAVILSERVVQASDNDNYFAMLQQLSTAITGRLAGPGGALDERELAQLQEAVSAPGPDQLDAFRCISLFNAFTARKSLAGFRKAQACIEQQLLENPRDSSLWAARAWMTALSAPEADQLNIPGSDATLSRALSQAQRAVALEPGNDFAHAHLGLIQWALGQRRSALTSFRRAVDLNPSNPSHLADLALFLTLSGEVAEAAGYAELARDRSAMPPDWYYSPDMHAALLRGDNAEALSLLQRYRELGGAYHALYALVAASGAGDQQLVEALREDVEALGRAHGGDPLYGVRIWVRNAQLLALYESRLRAAGITLPENGAS